MDRSPLFVSAQSFVDRLFRFTDPHRHGRNHRLFVCRMLEAIVATRSVVVANLARWLNEPRPLLHTEKRLCRMLARSEIPWEELRERATELSCQLVKCDDVIAFDPGDLSKRYAEKMENLHPVHDGSTGEIRLGYEDLSAEAIQWKNGSKQHIALFHDLTSSRCEDYQSQNHQIAKAITEIASCLKPGQGIWAFDRGHDRRRVFEVLLKLGLRWIVRVCQDREIALERGGQWESGLLMQMAREIPLAEAGIQLRFPKATHPYTKVGYCPARLPWSEKPLWLVVIHDPRNQDPVVMLTTLPVGAPSDAMLVFGRYLERWGQEEGYRFRKSWLNTEAIRTLNWEPTRNLSWLAHLAHIWIEMFYRSAPSQVAEQCERELKNFVPIESIRYREYRVAHLMRGLLIRQKNAAIAQWATTEVA